MNFGVTRSTDPPLAVGHTVAAHIIILLLNYIYFRVALFGTATVSGYALFGTVKILVTEPALFGTVRKKIKIGGLIHIIWHCRIFQKVLKKAIPKKDEEIEIYFKSLLRIQQYSVWFGMR